MRFIDTTRARKDLKPIYKNIKSTLKSFLRDNRDGVYYGNSNTLSTKDVAAMRISNNGKPGIILTDHFFNSCTIEAVNILIHELVLSRNTHTIFHVFQEKECEPHGDSGIELTEQFDNISDNYALSIHNLNEEDIDMHNYFALIPLKHDKFI